MEKYIVYLTKDGSVSVDVSNIKEACAAVSGFHFIHDTQAKDWIDVSGYIYSIEDNTFIGYVDYHCNFWFGPKESKFKYEVPYFNFTLNEINYDIQ